LAALSCASQVICNDSGPSHLADALGIPVIAFFGAARPEWFRPFREHNLVVIRDTCPYHPCADYCRFPEAYCLTELTPDIAWPEIREYLCTKAFLPLKNSPPAIQHSSKRI
jgi:ADP-heptose:LPS heptosyltransferase